MAVQKGKGVQKLSKVRVEKALRDTDANFTATAKRLKCSRKAVYDAVTRYDLQSVVDECRDEMVDVAENALHNLVRNEHASAIMFYLRTIGKSRGYVERVENSLAGSLEVKQKIDTPPRPETVEEWVATRNRLRGMLTSD